MIKGSPIFVCISLEYSRLLRNIWCIGCFRDVSINAVTVKIHSMISPITRVKTAVLAVNTLFGLDKIYRIKMKDSRTI